MFILGCNYWASNAGTEMWKNWSEEAVAEDMKILAENGVTFLRVFPNWRDFQPVMPLFAGLGDLYEYRMEGEVAPANSYFLDETMLERFETFCKIATAHNMKLIVGLITGWMSGRLFVPSALFGKNLYTDPTALMFEQRFIKGFVRRFKNNPAIYAWDLGNECNSMSQAVCRDVASNWTMIVSNAIRGEDSSRPIVSGMHSLGVENTWTIQDQAESTDILTTHPYPYWVAHCSVDPMGSIRTLLHATAETTYYAAVGGKPCLVEEIGTMGPMICDDEMAGNFMRVNLFSNWANGATGVMWWCANEQAHLSTAPYTWNMCERELGMMDGQRNPKPSLMEMKRFSDFLAAFNTELPSCQPDGVCILTKGQNQWGVAYVTYILAKQAGVNLTFCYCDQPLPEAQIYLLPSISGPLVMSKESYLVLKDKVQNGATLYVSNKDGFLTEFSELTGNVIKDSCSSKRKGQMLFGDQDIAFETPRSFYIQSRSADVLAVNEKGESVFTVNGYGNGKVFYLNFGLEDMLIDQGNAFDGNKHEIYKEVFRECLAEKIITCDNPYIGMTEHENICVLVNYSGHEFDLQLNVKEGYSIEHVLYGEKERIRPFDAVVLRILKVG